MPKQGKRPSRQSVDIHRQNFDFDLYYIPCLLSLFITFIQGVPVTNHVSRVNNVAAIL
jgi:hypothetical protein